MRIYRSIRWRRFFLFITSFLICSPLAFASTLKEKSNLNREKGAIYLEDFTEEPIILMALKQVPIYVSPQGKRSVGQLRKGKKVTVIAVLNNQFLIKGLAFLGHVLDIYMVKFGQTKMEHPCKKDLTLKELGQAIFIRKVILEIKQVFMEIKISLVNIIYPGMQT